MEVKNFGFSYEEYADISALHEADRALLQKAHQATALAYSPYSRFSVGAAALLENGEIFIAANQENASFPVGICAERALLSVISSASPGIAVDTLAISYHNEEGASDKPISPCGMCRQSIAEYENRFDKKMRIILGGKTGKIYVIAEAGMLLPFSFGAGDMR